MINFGIEAQNLREEIDQMIYENTKGNDEVPYLEDVDVRELQHWLQDFAKRLAEL
jgi:hypothetical protein